ncbi:SRPBCC family protein [Comamonas sp. J-3]|uniref:SRPBCC family protein n=1 Tax=Comamonas trifloxystrobinivorans TaxID=3350256 RepID=UPI003726EEB3
MTDSTIRRDVASRLIKAPPSAIYDAFVTREAVVQWLAPQGATMEIQVFEPRAGGLFRMTLTFAATPGKSTANTDVVVGRFVELVPQQRIVQAFEFDSPDPAFAGTMTMRWVLAAAVGGTSVTVTAENVPPGISHADHEIGMNSSLANLAAFVEAHQ